MDKNTRRPSHPAEEEARWTSRPASPHGDNTLEAQAQTQEPVQPLQSFLEGLRTMSPPPVAIEKALDSSQASHPANSAPSTTSSLSRASTLNSTITVQSRDTNITDFSLDSAFSDDTLSLSRSLTLPGIGTFPGDRILGAPGGRSFRILDCPTPFFEQHSLFSYGSIFPAPLRQFGPGHINRYLSWPDPQNEEIPLHSTQRPPTRHLTFPHEKSRSPIRPNSISSFVFEENWDTKVPDSSDMGASLPDDVNNPGTDTIPDEADCGSLQTKTDRYLQGGYSVEPLWEPFSVDCKRVDLHREFAQHYVSENPVRRAGKTLWSSMKARKAPERSILELPRRLKAEEKLPYRSDSGIYLSESSDVDFDAATSALHEKLNRIVPQQERGDTQQPRLSNPYNEKKSHREVSCEPLSPESDDNTGLCHEDSGAESEDDEDSAYDTLVESITCLVLDSSVVGNAEERGVPLELYVHSFLEQILSYSKPAAKYEAPSLPMYDLPIHALPSNDNDGPGNARESAMRPGGRGGNGGRKGGHKRTNAEARDRGNQHGNSNGDDLGDSSEEEQASSQQAKRLKTERKECLSCPFRKRNPTRFNVRNHGNCALASFSSFSLLKRHILNTHTKNQGSISCLRCQQTFEDRRALAIHSRQELRCPVATPSGDENPEDGVTDEVVGALRDRKKDDNIHEWPKLWQCLFPGDDIRRIPNSEFEPPVEWDEVREHCYDEDSLSKFVSNIAAGETITDHGFRYFVKGLGHCRDTRLAKNSKGRPYQGKGKLERDEDFVDMVNTALSRHRFPSQTQQPGSAVVCEPLQEVMTKPLQYAFDDQLRFGLDDSYILDSQFHLTYPNNPAYATHTPFGFVGASVPNTLYTSSDGATRPAQPQGPTSFSLAAAQDDHPGSAAEGRRHRLSAQYSSSGLSSRRSRDSCDLRTLRTEETQETQETQNTHYSQYSQDPQLLQDQGVALQHHHHQQHQQHTHADGGMSCDHGEESICPHCCPTAIIPGQGQGPSELSFRGIGEGTTGEFTPNNSLYISNSDEEFSPGLHVQ